MKIYCILFLLLVLSSCKNRNYTSAESILSQRLLVDNGVVKYPDGSLLYLIDSVKGKEFGNRFKFYRNSYLSSYSFSTDSIHASYRETFDSASHKIINIEGDPIVYETIDADSHPDSIHVEYLISNFSYDNIDFAISDSGRQYKNMPFGISLLNEYANLKYINAVEFIKSTKNAKRFYLIGKFTGKLKNTNIVKTYYDTIDYSRKVNILK